MNGVIGRRVGVMRMAPGAAIWLVLLVLLVVAALLSDAFLEPVYLANVVRQASPVGIAALGATVVMILGGVDLSVGAVVSFAAVFSAIQMAGQPGNIGTVCATDTSWPPATGATSTVRSPSWLGSSRPICTR